MITTVKERIVENTAAHSGIEMLIPVTWGSELDEV